MGAVFGQFLSYAVGERASAALPVSPGGGRRLLLSPTAALPPGFVTKARTRVDEVGRPVVSMNDFWGIFVAKTCVSSERLRRSLQVPMLVLSVFLLHWQLSVMSQSFFQHRYASHGQFTASPAWERVFFIVAYLLQGTTYFAPSHYAVLHRMHHAFSDAPGDPHSPLHYHNPVSMIVATARRYRWLLYGWEKAEPRFSAGTPHWAALDWWGNTWVSRLLWGALIAAFYWNYATTPWLFLLLPVHWTLGPVHGAIVNWCGHRYGYRNFERADVSFNTLPIDVLCGGELFQNNHHQRSASANFGSRSFEFDQTYWLLIRPLAALGVIQMVTAPPGPDPVVAPKAEVAV